MNKVQYFWDLLHLSPSFSLEEKRKIFLHYAKNKIEDGIEIFETELRDSINEYIKFETEKVKIGAEYITNLKTPWKIQEQHKIQKIQSLLQKAKQNESQEWNSKNSKSLLLDIL